MDIEIKNLTPSEIQKMGIPNWPIWEKEVSNFDWLYDEVEQFYIIEGEVILKADNKEYNLLPGHFVTCPKGLNCTWQVKEPIKKHYQFINS